MEVGHIALAHDEISFTSKKERVSDVMALALE